MKAHSSRRKGGNNAPRKSNNGVTFSTRCKVAIGAILPTKTTITPMKTTSSYLKVALLTFAVAILTATSARADTYSWTNFQSDIPGVAQHVDENLVNPWGMAASSGGTIWVSDNGTGVSTLYGQDGTARSLVVTIPTAARNREGGNPTGIVFNSTGGFVITENNLSGPSFFIFVNEDGAISGWNPQVALDHAVRVLDIQDRQASVGTIRERSAVLSN